MEPHVIGVGERQHRVHGTKRLLGTISLHALPATEELLRPHPNGGGLVAITATVDPTVFVGPEARVLGEAEVHDSVRLTGRSIVEDHAKVSGECWLRDDARASEHCVLEDRVTLVKHAHIAGTAHLSGALHIGYFAYIAEDSRVGGVLMIE